MLITQTISWPAATWPAASAATQYTVLQTFPGPLTVIVDAVTTLSTLLSFDDSQNLVFQVRPSSGTGLSRVYGPEVAVFVVNYVPCRSWLRDRIRQSIADRTDSGNNAQVNWPDDEVNGYIQGALTELNLLFPLEQEITVPLVPSSKDYVLPLDFYQVKSLAYVTVDGKLHLYLKEKPYRGGESTATSYIGYPKLGIMLSPLSGRFYPGHYDIFQEKLHLDWDPAGDGDYLTMRYLAKRTLPVDDATLMPVTPEDMELLSLRSQMKCWLRVEGQDTRLSRWRSRDDGSKRDDLPTIRHSMVIKQLYDQIVNDRRELRPRVRRLVRR